MEENPNAGLHHEDSDAELEYDEDGNPIPPPKSKVHFLFINVPSNIYK